VQPLLRSGCLAPPARFELIENFGCLRSVHDECCSPGGEPAQYLCRRPAPHRLPGYQQPVLARFPLPAAQPLCLWQILAPLYCPLQIASTPSSVIFLLCLSSNRPQTFQASSSSPQLSSIRAAALLRRHATRQEPYRPASRCTDARPDLLRATPQVVGFPALSRDTVSRPVWIQNTSLTPRKSIGLPPLASRYCSGVARHDLLDVTRVYRPITGGSISPSQHYLRKVPNAGRTYHGFR
jgi:hypothetical protein